MDQFDYHLVFKTLFVSHYRVFLVSMLKDVLDDVNNKYLMEQILKFETSYVILQQLPLFDIILLKLCSCIMNQPDPTDPFHNPFFLNQVIKCMF